MKLLSLENMALFHSNFISESVLICLRVEGKNLREDFCFLFIDYIIWAFWAVILQDSW